MHDTKLFLVVRLQFWKYAKCVEDRLIVIIPGSPRNRTISTY